jgi:hypothetical protein
VTKLIQRMREELVRRNFAESTMRTYLQVVEDFRRYSQRRLDERGRMISAATKSTCWKKESSAWAPS